MLSCHHHVIPGTIIIILGVVLISCGEGPGKNAPQAGYNKPNIIWLMVENIGPQLECYGSEGIQTPNINQLAEQGRKYFHAYFTASICSPSRSAIITGVHQNIINAQHQRSNRDIPLPEEYKPITWHLRNAGYTCILGHHRVMGKGRKIDCNFKFSPLGSYDGKEHFGLFDKLDTFNLDDQPFFASIQLKVTHRGPHWKTVRNESRDPVSIEDITLPPYLPEDSVILLDMARYLDVIEYMDEEVGDVMRELDDKGLAENTVVFFFGDNGIDNVRSMGTLYRAALHVPLIIRWPGKIEPGTVSDRLISNTDITATTLHIAGVEVPGNMTGIPFLDTENPVERNYVYSADDVHDEEHDRRRSIITREFHYIRNYFIFKPYDDFNAFNLFYSPGLQRLRLLNEQGKLTPCQKKLLAEHRPEEELYHFKEDPFELNNLADSSEYREILDKLRGYLDQWQGMHHDHGLDPANWERIDDLLHNEVYRWVENERPDLYQRIRNGEEILIEATEAYKKEKNIQ